MSFTGDIRLSNRMKPNVNTAIHHCNLLIIIS